VRKEEAKVTTRIDRVVSSGVLVAEGAGSAEGAAEQVQNTPGSSVTTRK
jgi:hypothetical protein